MTDLISPNLDLFVYNLLDENHSSLWQNLPFHIKIHIQEDLQPKTEYSSDYSEIINLKHGFETHLNNHYICFLASEKKHFNYPIEGFYYPVNLNDTSGLLINCSVTQTPENFSLTDFFKDFKEKLADFFQGDLGKTWIISGTLPKKADPEETAKTVYKSLLPNNQWRNVETGKFLGAKIFQIPPTPDTWENKKDQGYVIIILYPNSQSQSQAQQFYKEWMRLFCYRQSIFWANYQAQQLKERLKEHFFNTDKKLLEVLPYQNKVSNLTIEDLEKLETDLNETSKNMRGYTLGLGYLEIQQQTIETNLYNYQICLNNIIEEANNIGETDLRFLQKLTHFTNQKYIPQIKSDIASLTPGIKALENITATLRGIVEIEQTKQNSRQEENNKAFQQTLEIWGLSLASAGIAATAISPFVPTILKTETNDNQTPPLPAIEGTLQFIFTLFFSLLILFLAKWSAELRIKFHRPHTPKNYPKIK